MKPRSTIILLLELLRNFNHLQYFNLHHGPHNMCKRFSYMIKGGEKFDPSLHATLHSYKKSLPIKWFLRVEKRPQGQKIPNAIYRENSWPMAFHWHRRPRQILLANVWKNMDDYENWQLFFLRTTDFQSAVLKLLAVANHIVSVSKEFCGKRHILYRIS